LLKFGIIAEGPTDQTVIENILLGYFAEEEEEPAVQYIQPPHPQNDSLGGWWHVFECLQRGDAEGALQFNDYLVIHIDTDVQEDPGFNVPKQDGERELSVSEIVERVVGRLKQGIDAALFEANESRFLFAIAVDSIECWLLPLLETGKKAAKTTGCLETANRALRKADEDGLSAGEVKFIRAYEKASSGYRKRKVLLQLREKNPSLALFIQKLDQLQRGGSPLPPCGNEIE
jgi:hypothetical protein